MKSRPVNISAPTLIEKIILRSMIFIGLISICYFLYALLAPENIGEPILYSLLIVTILYLCLHNIIEWYNYYSISIPPKPTEKIDITVDFFTTFCKGEPYEMITETLLAIKAIRYPHKTFLCDEADDPFLKKFCEEHDIIHVTRTIKIDAKAGNINNALKYSDAELCVVLDPDHVPVPEMLDQLVHYFHDENMGYVQIVQAYKNMDDSLIAKGAAQQTFQFYGPMMMCMNTYGTAQAIGANCIFRRKALDSIGGHAAGLAEDMHTAMRIQSEGWKTIYVPEVLTRGLVPSTLSAYYKQQLKWSKGSFDLLFHVYPKLFKKFTIRQKIHYALLPLHYLAGFIYLLNFLIPVFSLFSGIIPLKMDFLNFSIIGLPILLSTFFIRMFVQRWVMEETERGMHIVGGVLQIGTWWIFILGFYYSCIGAKVPYTPTPKDGNEANNWPLNVPNIIIALLSIAAIVYGLHYDFNPFSVFMSALAALNVMFMIIVIGMSRQEQIKNMFHKKKTFDSTRTLIRKGKRQFWFFRHFIYSVLRRTGIVVLILSCLLSFYVLNQFNQYKFASKNIENKENIENESFVFLLFRRIQIW